MEHCAGDDLNVLQRLMFYPRPGDSGLRGRPVSLLGPMAEEALGRSVGPVDAVTVHGELRVWELGDGLDTGINKSVQGMQLGLFTGWKMPGEVNYGDPDFCGNLFLAV